MKRIILFTLIFAIGVIFTANPSESISFKKMNWKSYNIKFQVPRHWKITRSDGKAFIAKGDGVVMAIYPKKYSSHTAKSIAKRAYYGYPVIGYKRIHRQKYLAKGNTGLNRYIIFGSAKYTYKRPAGFYGRPVQFGIIGMTNPRESISLFCRFYWFTDESQSKISRNYANTYRLANSFRVLNRYRTRRYDNTRYNDRNDDNRRYNSDPGY